ncbi:phage-related protein family protein [Achromobacter arsenitoxydans SY8]|uniref:Phage-related protein family protein n=2 Tax=Achromobacter TaxID=222 RepID=H0F9M4_9BURK|nr:phage-related protein family protein [Achromobacter arsenitoxydans SY8]
MNEDGYLSAVLGSAMLDAGAAGLSGLDDLAMYAEGGLPARVVDMIPDTAVSRGVEITGDDRVRGELDRLKALPALADAWRWARLTGGGAIVIVAKDGRSLREPLDLEGLVQLLELKVFTLDDVSATEKRYSDPNEANYGMPELYRVRTQAAGVPSAEFLVHESRLIEVPGDPLPAKLNRKGIPWAGRPAVTRAFRAIRRYGEGLRWSLRLLEKKQQAVHKMKGLAEAIEAQLEDVVRKRVEMVDAVRNALNGVAVDSEDDYQVLSTDMSGVKDALAEFQVAVASESGYPVTSLFGRSAAGLNATGDGDLEGFYNTVAMGREVKINPALERVVSLIRAQRGLERQGKGQGEAWSISWPALKPATAKETAEVRKVNAEAEAREMDALSAAVDNGLSPEQAFAYMKENGRYGLIPNPSGQSAKSYAAET